MNFIDKQTFQKPECVLRTSSPHLITQVITLISPNCIIKKKKKSLQNLDMSICWYKKYLKPGYEVCLHDGVAFS